MDMFIKIDAPEGESHDETHKGEIDVLAWSRGVYEASMNGNIPDNLKD